LSAIQLTILPENETANDGDFRNAMNDHALEDVKVDTMMMSFGRDGSRGIAVPDDDLQETKE
jgi:hypothetical protein